MSRLLDNAFELDLLTGNLKELLAYIHSDHTLDIEIRDNYINIYYSGGNVLKVTKQKTSYKFEFNWKYLDNNPFLSQSIIQQHIFNRDWYAFFPAAKQTMDIYFSKHTKEEREFQQLVIRENNYSTIANSTDYFIIDIEYKFGANARFDLVAVEWHSESSKRKLQKNHEPKLVLFEMKYSDRALNGTSGMVKHLNDYANLVFNPTAVSIFKIEMLDLLKQKRRLGLIPCLSDSNNKNPLKMFAPEIELIFLIVNHDPASKILQTELNTLTIPNVKFISSNFMGYGLYHQNVYTLNQFLSSFPNQIYELSPVTINNLP